MRYYGVNKCIQMGILNIDECKRLKKAQMHKRNFYSIPMQLPSVGINAYKALVHIQAA